MQCASCTVTGPRRDHTGDGVPEVNNVEEECRTWHGLRGSRPDLRDGTEQGVSVSTRGGGLSVGGGLMSLLGLWRPTPGEARRRVGHHSRLQY